MPQANFYLKKPEPNGLSLIYLQFKYGRKKLVFSFGQSVSPNNWNLKKQRVKSNAKTTSDGKHLLNDLLDNLEKVCINAYNSEIKNGIPETAILRKYLSDFINQNDDGDRPTLYYLIERFKAGEIKFKGRKVSKGSRDNYDAVFKHLKGFEAAKKYHVNFKSINLDFLYQYTDYLENDLELESTTIKKDIGLIKRFMGEAVDLGYTNNLSFKHSKFTYSEVETYAVYLTQQEIITLYDFDFSNNKRLERVRDLFVFGCLTGLRFSDITTIQPENFQKNGEEIYIHKVVRKNKELVVIPCDEIVITIRTKYEGNMPKGLSNQKFNEYIKEVSKMVGLEEKGRLPSKPEKELWQCISSHTARRSFATNRFLEGFEPIGLMKITGHKSEKSFLKYIKVSKQDSARRLSEHMKRVGNTKKIGNYILYEKK